jgi:hypothetical protein
MINEEKQILTASRRGFLKAAGAAVGVSALTGLWGKGWTAFAAPLADNRLSRDLKGQVRWAVILCEFNDIPRSSVPISTFSDFIAGPGKGGVFDYWKDISYGAIDLTGSKVFGWWKMQYSYFKDALNPSGKCGSGQQRCAWITEAKRLAKENGVDLSPFYGVIAVMNANADDSAAGGNLALGVSPNWGQGKWRWCSKCMVLAYGGNAPAACPAGGVHDLGKSSNYLLAMELPSFGGQNNWKWCQKCQALAYAGLGSGRCSAGGEHDQSKSADYRLASGSVGFPGQPDWKWCKKCQVLAHAGTGPGACAAGGGHDYSSSANYTMVVDYGSNLNVSFAAHEMAHCYGLLHAHCAGKPDDYCCPWDVMGTGVAAYRPKFDGPLTLALATDSFAPLGPGLCAPQLLRFGWLPDDRIKTVMSSTSGETITLAALNRPDLKNPLMAKIVASDRMVTAEFRQRRKWDRGLPRDAVVIHEVRSGGEPVLLGDYAAGQRWADFGRGFGIFVNGIDTAASTATITI